MATKFETQTCSRCHGSGKHSYCEMYKDTCFKCGGSGVTLSKRGLTASAYLKQSLRVPITQIKVGDKIRQSSITHGGQSYSYIAIVTEIKEGGEATSGKYKDGEWTYETYKMVSIATEHPKFGKHGLSAGPKHEMECYNDYATKLEQALAYQETLTKTGTVRKK